VQILIATDRPLANSFERIHRSNLVGMGILPIRMPDGWRPGTLQLAPGDTIEIGWDLLTLTPRRQLPITIRRQGVHEAEMRFGTALVETEREVALLRAGGMIPMILQRALAASDGTRRATAAIV